MEIRDIVYFKEVAEHLNLGRAAQALDLSTTALSKSLRRLEKSVGAKLVKRTPKGVELTGAGNALFAQAGRLQRLLDDIRHEATDLGAGYAGHITVGATPGVSEYCVSDAYAALLKEAPSVSLRAILTYGIEAAAMVQEGKVDFTVNTIRSVFPPDLVCEPLFSDYQVVYVAANHPLALRKRVTLADLAKESWAADIDPGNWNILCQLFRTKGLEPPRLILESNSLGIRLPVIESSNLVMHSASVTVQMATQRYKLVALQVEELHLERRICVYYRKGGYLSPAALRMIGILKEQGKLQAAKLLPRKPRGS
jgi:DNA-binding transcriptional LysR family regulator